MNINSLLIKTSLIFARNESEIVERESYIAIKTPTNPGYHWGNYLIFKKPPVGNDVANWKEIFAREFPYYKVIQHYAFAWDELSPPADPAYLEQQMVLEKSVALVTDTLSPPPHYNHQVQIRPLATDQDWEEADLLQSMTRDDSYDFDEFLAFKKAQSLSYLKLIKAGRGQRFGAFMNDKLVADLGIFHEDGIGRFQNVVTHPDYRKQGICATLVYESGQRILQTGKVKTLVMIADPDYHAARVYQSVGFKPKEESYNLYWYKHA